MNNFQKSLKYTGRQYKNSDFQAKDHLILKGLAGLRQEIND